MVRRLSVDGRKVTISPIHEDGIATVAQLIVEIFDREVFSLGILLENHAKYRELFMGAYDGGEMVGFVFGWPQGALVVQGLAVVEAFRRKGIGTALLKSFEDAAQKAGFERYVLGAQWEAIPFYFSYGLDSFANIQITPDEFPWGAVSSLRSDYEIRGANVFGEAVPSQLMQRLNEEFGVEARYVKGDVESISIQIKPEEISQEALDAMKRDFNAYDSQYGFYKTL